MTIAEKTMPPAVAEQDFSRLRDERAVGGNPFDRHQVNEDGADDDIHHSDRNHAKSQSARKRAARVAYLAGNFCGVPPAAEAEKGADQGGAQGRRQRQRARTLRDERNEIGPGAQVKCERPNGESGKHGKFQPCNPAEKARADSRAEDV